MPKQENARASQSKKSKQNMPPEKETDAVPETKRQRRTPLVDTASLGVRPSTTVVINPEEDSAGIRRVAPLEDAALCGKKQTGSEDLRTSNRESGLGDPVGSGDVSDVSSMEEPTAEQELLRAVGLDLQSEN